MVPNMFGESPDADVVVPSNLTSYMDAVHRGVYTVVVQYSIEPVIRATSNKDPSGGGRSYHSH